MTERGRQIVQKVVGRIAEVAPEGLGRWDRAWDIIAEPSDAFLDALGEWEEVDSAESRRRLQAAADEFVRAWRSAAVAWLRHEAGASDHDHTVGAWGAGG